jgi:hypothetical protein
LAVAVGALSIFFLMALWKLLLMRESLPPPDLWPAIKVYGFFLAKAKTLIKVD